MCEGVLQLLLLLLLRGTCRRRLWLQANDRDDAFQAKRLRPGTREAMAGGESKQLAGSDPSDSGIGGEEV